MYAVTVTFVTKPGQFDMFLPLVLENARISLELEQGCHRFDVCTDPELPERVFLYELYDDRAAFDLHLKSSHFRSFDTAIGSMIADKRVHCFSNVEG